MPKTWAWAILVYVGCGWGQNFVSCRLLSGVTFSPSPEELGHDRKVQGFQPWLFLPVHHPNRPPWQSTAAIRVSGCMSHPGLGQDSAHRKGCPWGILSPYLPSWLALLSPLKADSKLTSRKASACLPYLWSAGHHSQLPLKFQLFLCLLSLSPDPW